MNRYMSAIRKLIAAVIVERCWLKSPFKCQVPARNPCYVLGHHDKNLIINLDRRVESGQRYIASQLLWRQWQHYRGLKINQEVSLDIQQIRVAYHRIRILVFVGHELSY